jgi:hypothetical protein
LRRPAASSPGEYIVLNQNAGEKISIKSKTSGSCSKIGYDEKGLNARAELLRRFGHEVISVTQNEAAQVALSSYRDVELFIVGHTAQERTRKEMVAWLKGNYPNVKIVALNPSRDVPQIARRLIFPDPAVVALDPGISLPRTAECKPHASHPANLRYNFVSFDEGELQNEPDKCCACSQGLMQFHRRDCAVLLFLQLDR